MAAMAIPAIWQLSGYVMALFLAGFRGIPQELREAAAVDGASTYRLYRNVIFPQLTPVALSALIIVGHMSMKMFDLIMSVSGAQWLTEVPAVYVWQALLTSDYAKAAAISIILLLLVAIVIVPYLIYTNRQERSA
jgi:glucose/mannose transport system permease protein